MGKNGIDMLPSGSYRIRKTIDHKTYTLTFDHKPTQKELREALEIKRAEQPTTDADSITFREAASQYVELKKNVLSPASIREYGRMCDRLPEWFPELQISKITQPVMQKLVNEMSASVQPKTVKDRHAFCTAVIRLFYPSRDYFTTLPKKPLKNVYIPTHEDVTKILDEAKGTMFDIPLHLACYGMRREEICALTTADLSADNFLTINKALVQDSEKKWIIKTTKTVESSRTIAIDPELAEAIRSLPPGKVFNGYPQSISNFMRRTQIKLGLELFSIHKLRHYFCTVLSENNVSESDILAMGGWKQSSTVMKDIYRHSNMGREKERMINAANILKSSQS